MMHDRTTKRLLVLIVLALWGLLLRPVFTPVPTKAAPAAPATETPGLVLVPPHGIYLYHADGHVYLFDYNLKLKAQAIHELDPTRQYYTFRTIAP